MKDVTGKKFKVSPITYEIEIISLSKELPKEQEIDFAEWITSKVHECPLGRNHDHFAYTGDFNDDIAVEFTIRIFEDR